MAIKMDYYKLLGVVPLAKEEEIKKAYKALAKKFHPDLNPDSRDMAERKMKELTEAQDILTNYNRRKEYDDGPPFRHKVPAFLKSTVPGVKDRHMREEGEPELSFFEKLKKLMFEKNVEEEKKKKLEHDKKLTKAGVDSFIMGASCLEKKQTGMLELAKAEFTSVLKESPENPEALFNMGLIEYKFGNYGRAVDYFKKAQVHFPNDADVRRFIEMLED